MILESAKYTYECFIDCCIDYREMKASDLYDLESQLLSRPLIATSLDHCIPPDDINVDRFDGDSCDSMINAKCLISNLPRATCSWFSTFNNYPLYIKTLF